MVIFSDLWGSTTVHLSISTSSPFKLGGCCSDARRTWAKAMETLGFANAKWWQIWWKYLVVPGTRRGGRFEKGTWLKKEFMVSWKEVTWNEMKCMKWMNWHKSIDNDLKWRNWNNELKRTNCHEWIEMKELKCGNWHEWTETNESTWANWNEGIEMQELKRMNWREWIEISELTWRNWNAWLETHDLTWMNWNAWIDIGELK